MVEDDASYEGPVVLPEHGEDPLENCEIYDGTCFYVISIMLPILEAATGGRVTPYRFWLLSSSRDRIRVEHDDGISGVDYQTLGRHYRDLDVCLFSRYQAEDIEALENRGTSEEIAELLLQGGYWFWIRPDRFPVDTNELPVEASSLPVFSQTQQTRWPTLPKLPTELLYTIISHLSLSDIVSIARTDKTLWFRLLGTTNVRDHLAKAYMHSSARWCLPHGEAELTWWNQRNGDSALGWSYMKRCYSESHSMRNRRRIWQVAESIEEEYDKERAKWAEEYGIHL
ncbi:hypothetical protein RhiJN_08434 [Ceratobasidium sp. AG-Ba]|nr:hypothetical protein RhiJN_08434 [Ceratobasidium sp. AG-Ba]QRW09220.1 hypothetical protein RhiLY_08219 [Ceratobasidium sp. AG-Ba]